MFPKQYDNELLSFIKDNKGKFSTDVLCAQFASEKGLAYMDVFDRFKHLEGVVAHTKNIKEKALKQIHEMKKDGQLNDQRIWTEPEDDLLKVLIIENPEGNRTLMAHKLQEILPHRTYKAIYVRLAKLEKVIEEEKVTREAKAGDTVTGVVSGIASYGAFIVANGEKFLLHISQMTDEYIYNIEDYLAIGDEVTAVLIEDKDGRLGLSTIKHNGGLKKKILLPTNTFRDTISQEVAKKLNNVTKEQPKFEVAVGKPQQNSLVTKIDVMRQEILNIINTMFDEIKEEAEKTQQKGQELEELKNKLQSIIK